MFCDYYKGTDFWGLPQIFLSFFRAKNYAFESNAKVEYLISEISEIRLAISVSFALQRQAGSGQVVLDANADGSLLLCAPAIESLVNNEHTYRVAGIKESARRRIVRGADEVETRLLHLAHFADFGIVEGTSTQHAVIMVYTGSVDEHRPPRQ